MFVRLNVVAMNRLLLHRLCSLFPPSMTLNAIGRRTLCVSVTENVLAGNEQTDDVTFGVLDPKFMDSKSITKLSDRRGTKPRKFENEDEHGQSKSIGVGVKHGGRKDSYPSYLHGVKSRESLGTKMMADVDDSADTFGKLVSEAELVKMDAELGVDENLESDGDDDHHIRLSKYDRKHPQAWYDHRLIKLSKRGQVLEAVRMLKEEMIEKDRVMPTKVSYTVVISALAKAGYTTLAFKLFYEMRERGIKAPKHVFTALFNACANCPDKDKGLRQAHYLRDYMQRKAFLNNYIVYKAQIKAFARTGDLRTAFASLDEAIDDGNRLDQEACSMILMACISDKKNGFLNAVKVWRVMLEHGLRPQIHQYNLLTRCVQECGVGDARQLDQLLMSSPTKTQERVSPVDGQRASCTTFNRSVLRSNMALDDQRGKRRDCSSSKTNSMHEYDCANITEDTVSGGTELVRRDLPPAIPDILSPKPQTEHLVGIEFITNAKERLSLLGGVSGLLSRMRKDGVKPDIKTFSLLVDCINSDEGSEEYLLLAMNEWKIEPDTPFCNLLMRKRVFRKDVSGAKALLELMGSHQLSPDLHTFATLALMCSTKEEAGQLLQDMEAHDIAPTTEVLSHLNQAAYMNFNYRRWLLEQMDELRIEPDELFIRQCEKRIREATRMIADWDRQDRDTERERNFRNKFDRFNEFYKPWLARTRLKLAPREPRSLNELRTRTPSERLNFPDIHESADPEVAQ